jgi:isocitrate/isopropylmalate dehydrogenase
MSNYKVALIAGDGIGREVVPEGVRVLEEAGRRFGITFEWREFPWSCEYYVRTGQMMPTDGLEILSKHDAIYLGAVGFPGVPDHVSLWGLLLKIRRSFEQYVNLRPIRLMPNVTSPLRDRGVGDIDIMRWSARTPKGSIPTRARPFSRIRKPRPSSRRASSRGGVWIESCAMPSNSRVNGRAAN